MPLQTPLEPAFEPEPYREPFFSLRRPSRSILSRFIAHLLVRLLLVAPLPANLQAAAALFPVSMLWSLVPSSDQAQPETHACALGGPKNRVRGYQLENGPSRLGERPQAAESHRGYLDVYVGIASELLVARYYDPSTARFTTQDSYLGQPDNPPSLHRYLYANANPTRYVDVTGHQAAPPPYLTAQQMQGLTPQQRAEISNAQMAFARDSGEAAKGFGEGVGGRLREGVEGAYVGVGRLSQTMMPPRMRLPAEVAEVAPELRPYSAEEVKAAAKAVKEDVEFRADAIWNIQETGPMALDVMTEIGPRETGRIVGRGTVDVLGAVEGGRAFAGGGVRAFRSVRTKLSGRTAVMVGESAESTAVVLDPVVPDSPPVLQFDPPLGPTSGGAGSGPVRFKLPANATPEQIAQARSYCQMCNESLQAGELSPTGRVSTKGQLRRQASRAAAREKARAAQAGQPYQGHPGHVPDTTWTGNPAPPRWLDLEPKINTSLGGQAPQYPVGYKPTQFILELEKEP